MENLLRLRRYFECNVVVFLRGQNVFTSGFIFYILFSLRWLLVWCAQRLGWVESYRVTEWRTLKRYATRFVRPVLSDGSENDRLSRTVFHIELWHDIKTKLMFFWRFYLSQFYLVTISPFVLCTLYKSSSTINKVLTILFNTFLYFFDLTPLLLGSVLLYVRKLFVNE